MPSGIFRSRNRALAHGGHGDAFDGVACGQWRRVIAVGADLKLRDLAYCDSIVAMFVSENRATTFLLVAAASFSHWALDLIVHVPDLSLYDDTAKVGFGLWRVVVLSFSCELSLLCVGAWLYARWATFKGPSSRYLYWGFVAVLAALQLIDNFGPPPSSGQMIAIRVALRFTPRFDAIY